jgi:hypothetical protein
MGKYIYVAFSLAFLHGTLRGFLYHYSCGVCSRLKIIFVLEDDGGEQEARAASGGSAAGSNL